MMFSIFILSLAVIIYGMLPVCLVISACYFVAYFIGCIPDIWSYIKTLWKMGFRKNDF